MRLVSLTARAVALALSIGSVSFAFAGSVASPATGSGPVGGAVAVTGATRPSLAAVTTEKAQAGAVAESRRQKKRTEAKEVAAKRAAVERAAAKRVRIARARAAAKRRWARLPATKKLGFKWPAQGWITSGFGPRADGFHHGMDIACRKGSAIRAARNGRVVFVANIPIYGKTVVIQHAHGYSTLYAHMKRINVRAGRKVGTRQLIGRCGSTGHSTGNHLHFELRRNGRFLKPAHYLT
ncbi:MAG TPA: M23 family metallopeptidase [Actinomycetota bacterium]